jgi:hypothetical protein
MKAVGSFSNPSIIFSSGMIFSTFFGSITAYSCQGSIPTRKSPASN